MSVVPILLGVPGLPREPELVAALTRPGTSVTVVRRCVDAVDLLGAASAGRARVAVIGPGLPRLAHDTVARLDADGVRVVGVTVPGDAAGHQRMQDLGLSVVTLAMDDVDGAAAELARVIDNPARHVRVLVDHGVTDHASATGRIVAVWGPTGAPGRTSVAIGLADELSRSGTPCLLVDADTHGGSIAANLGLAEESSGIVVACRHADAGALDVDLLAGAARSLTSQWRVITGIPRAERWAELRPASLARLWQACRETPGVTVADIGFSLEADEEYLVDTRTPRRNAAALSAVMVADLLVAVGTATPVGIDRLIAGIADLRRIAPDREIQAVVTRVRRGPLGRDADRQVREALARHAGIFDAVLVPDDQETYDHCLREGRTLAEVAPKSRARIALADLAARIHERTPAAA